MATASEPKTLLEAIKFFADYENCHKAVIAIRWPNGKVACPVCGSEDVTYLEKARVWKCYAKHATPKFSLKKGTIFEDSPIGLDKWLPALWLLTNCKNGISSYELARALGVTQKTAWFMLSRLRLALQDEDGGKLSGIVEVDETYIGGAARNMHKKRKERILGGHKGGHKGKVAVMGLLERKSDGAPTSKVRTRVVQGARAYNLMPVVRENVEKLSQVHTDALKSYDKLSEDFFHKFIDHAEKYVDGNVHTNGLENFWALLKRAIGGTYVSVQPFHLFRYLDEQAYRFNNRASNDAERFVVALRGIIGKRLTYTALIGSELPERC